MTGHAYATSARTAARMGPFAGYTENREPMNRVLRMHRDEAAKIDDSLATRELLSRRPGGVGHGRRVGRGLRRPQLAGHGSGADGLPRRRLAGRHRPGPGPAASAWATPTASSGRTSTSQVATDDGARAATKFYVNGLEPVVTVDTARGYRIQGTTAAPGEGRRRGHRRMGVEALRRHRPGDLVPLALHQLVGEPQHVPLPPLPEAYWTGEHHVAGAAHG